MNHEQTHTQTMRKPAERHGRQWVCAECSQAFKKREHLVRHTRSHTKEKPYVCHLCSKAYGRQDSLIRHGRTHGSLQAAPDQVTTSLPGLGADNSDHQITPNDEAQIPISYSVSPTHSFIPSASSSTGQINPSRIRSGIYGTSNLESPVQSSRSAQSGSLSGGAMPSGLDHLAVNFGCSTHESFWLLGEDFDLNTLGSSIATVGPSWSYGDAAALQNIGRSIDQEATYPTEPSIQDATPGDFRTLVRERWYSRPSPEVIHGQLPFMRQEYQDKVDEAYRAGLSSRLRPCLHDSVLPSVDFLNLCIKLYFAKFHPLFPIVHSASFRPSSENALLLLSICSLGALFVGSSSAAARGRAIFMKLNKTILASWEAYVFRGGREALSVAQAAVLGQTFGILSGNPNDLLLAESFHGTIIAWTRQAGIFHVKKLPQDANLSDQDLPHAWRSWSQSEEAMRVVLALYIHDSQFASIFHHEPLLRHNPQSLPQCSSDELFSAHSAERWHDLIKKQNFHPPTTTTQASGPASAPEEPPYQAFTRSYAILSGCVAVICEARCGNLDDDAVDEHRSALIAWHAGHVSNSSHGGRDLTSLMVLWHEAFMHLYVDFDLLERVLGRDGVTTGQDDVKAIYDWVPKAEGQLCAVHAILIYRRLEALPINTELALHVPKSLFYSGLVIYCHVKFRSAGACADVDIPEMRSSDSWRSANPVPLPSSSALLSQLDASVLYNVADLLRRQGHWEVSRRFASILEALIETLAV